MKIPRCDIDGRGRKVEGQTPACVQEYNKKMVFAKKTWSTEVDICSVFQREWNRHRPHGPGKVRGVQPSADRHHP